ncbi:hypothetical protein GF1_08510 [Desulfolithobacter dissulfuricans]|uniref:Uncharacterized protein n=1 Tax=Desulfolithobacter dissulfuricans TaxID=2795293 RepID=A0A915U0D9_9BACT|nr:hypothetical protein [Desulfolithobacter dissulfuricans]BCO08475.1 hypothetical protein GF1_08510 [Desulfolithobacter dissulfuricans]
MKDWTLVLMPLWSLALGVFLVMMTTATGDSTRYPVISMPQWHFSQPPVPGVRNRPGTGKTDPSNQTVRVSPFAYENNSATEVSEEKELPPLKLTLIAVAGAKKICRINGQLFSEGQPGDGFQVTRIDDTHVEIIFDADQQPAVLYLNTPGMTTDVQ